MACRIRNEPTISHSIKDGSTKSVSPKSGYTGGVIACHAAIGHVHAHNFGSLARDQPQMVGPLHEGAFEARDSHTSWPGSCAVAHDPSVDIHVDGIVGTRHGNKPQSGTHRVIGHTAKGTDGNRRERAGPAAVAGHGTSRLVDAHHGQRGAVRDHPEVVTDNDRTPEAVDGAAEASGPGDGEGLGRHDVPLHDLDIGRAPYRSRRCCLAWGCLPPPPAVPRG